MTFGVGKSTNGITGTNTWTGFGTTKRKQCIFSLYWHFSLYSGFNMKVTGYVWIVHSDYIGIHKIGIVCDDGKTYAYTLRRPLPKLGQTITRDGNDMWDLRGDRFYPLTKLHKHLYGLEHGV